MPAGVFIDQIPRFEVVGAIDDHIHAAEQIGCVCRRKVGHDSLDHGGRIDRGEMPGGGDGLRQPCCHVGLVE